MVNFNVHSHYKKNAACRRLRCCGPRQTAGTYITFLRLGTTAGMSFRGRWYAIFCLAFRRFPAPARNPAIGQLFPPVPRRSQPRRCAQSFQAFLNSYGKIPRGYLRRLGPQACFPPKLSGGLDSRYVPAFQNAPKLFRKNLNSHISGGSNRRKASH